MAAHATSKQASELLEDESLAEEVEYLLCFISFHLLLSRSMFLLKNENASNLYVAEICLEVTNHVIQRTSQDYQPTNVF